MGFMEQISHEIRKCENLCYKFFDEIELNSNTLRFLEQKATIKDFSLPVYTMPNSHLIKLFGLTVKINDNLEFKEFAIPIEEFEKRNDVGFVESYKRIYRFIID
jgi:hypothetical protein